jgi:hypothetical protein
MIGLSGEASCVARHVTVFSFSFRRLRPVARAGAPQGAPHRAAARLLAVPRQPLRRERASRRRCAPRDRATAPRETAASRIRKSLAESARGEPGIPVLARRGRSWCRSATHRWSHDPDEHSETPAPCSGGTGGGAGVSSTLHHTAIDWGTTKAGSRRSYHQSASRPYAHTLAVAPCSTPDIAMPGSTSARCPSTVGSGATASCSERRSAEATMPIKGAPHRRA